eukprot:14257997-Alexandrium_andersonii.AAC.1
MVAELWSPPRLRCCVDADCEPPASTCLEGRARNAAAPQGRLRRLALPRLLHRLRLRQQHSGPRA